MYSLRSIIKNFKNGPVLYLGLKLNIHVIKKPNPSRETIPLKIAAKLESYERDRYKTFKDFRGGFVISVHMVSFDLWKFRGLLRRHVSRIFLQKSSVADPWHFGVDADPQIHASDKWIRIRILTPPIFVTDLQFANKKTNFFNDFFCLLLFEGAYLHNFLKVKNQKESQNSRNQGFSYYFCMVVEDPDPYLWLMDPDLGGPKTCGSGGSGFGSGSATLQKVTQPVGPEGHN